jgi:hypothetical protein
VSTIIPFRATKKRQGRKSPIVTDQIPPTPPSSDEEDMVTIQMKDGTWKTIHCKNLELDVQYREGVPYLVVKGRGAS